VDYNCNFVDFMALGVCYSEHFWRIDSRSTGNSAGSNRHTVNTRQTSSVKAQAIKKTTNKRSCSMSVY
jgi:hypothetical protein